VQQQSPGKGRDGDPAVITQFDATALVPPSRTAEAEPSGAIIVRG
jgi:hypothetical protein